jgi:hypothetical protein
MISVEDVTMRFDARPVRGGHGYLYGWPPSRHHRSERRRQIHIHENPGELEPTSGYVPRPKKMGILRQD